MSCQDVIMSLLYLYHVAKMSHTHPSEEIMHPSSEIMVTPSSEIVDPSEEIMSLTRPVESVTLIRIDPYSGNKE